MNTTLAYLASALGRMAATLAVLAGGLISASSVLLVLWVPYAIVMRAQGALSMLAIPTAGVLLMDIGLAARRRRVQDASGAQPPADFDLTGRDRWWLITALVAGLLLGLIQAALPPAQSGLLARLVSGGFTAGSFWLLATIIVAAGGLGRLWSRNRKRLAP